VSVTVRRNSSPYDEIDCENQANSTSQVTLIFTGAPPSANSYTATVVAQNG